MPFPKRRLAPLERSANGSVGRCGLECIVRPTKHLREVSRSARKGRAPLRGVGGGRGAKRVSKTP